VSPVLSIIRVVLVFCLGRRWQLAGHMYDSSNTNPTSFMDLAVHRSFTRIGLLSAVTEGASGSWPLYPFHMISARSKAQIISASSVECGISPNVTLMKGQEVNTDMLHPG